ncbi:MAG: hypothetical protein EPO16_07430 [Dehalococcoidia bacterium]|nr:MAG: hypothetical protein EPO16_07430 [Dehalococcoidia bacterium]
MAWPNAATALAALAVAGIACSSQGSRCVEVPLTPQARATLAVESPRVGFIPLPPCAAGRGFTVASVFVDALPGTPPGQRISFIVERNGEPSYVLSETRAAVTSTQIPQGTRRLRVTSNSAVADGFIGMSEGGGEMAYLRWREGGVTYELDATLGRGLDEADVRQIAAALMRRAPDVSP